LSQVRRVVVRRVDHHGVLELELLLESRRQVDVDDARMANLDVDDSALAGRVDKSGDLEAAQAELLGNVHL
jgi:hypothetical protein